MSISMRNVWKTYGEGVTAVHALQETDLDVPQGQFTVILGPSGSGKTTLLNLVGAIDDASEGMLEVSGIDLVGLDDKDRIGYRRTQVGLVFQFFNLIPTLTAIENVELVADLTGEDNDWPLSKRQVSSHFGHRVRENDRRRAQKLPCGFLDRRFSFPAK